MRNSLWIGLAITALVVGSTGCDAPQSPAPTEEVGDPEVQAPRAASAGLIDDERINNADRDEPGAWLAHGRTYEEQRFSPLTAINRDNVAELGLAWHRDMNTNRAQESTPIVVDGVMYFTSAWSRVYAFDAATRR